MLVSVSLTENIARMKFDYTSITNDSRKVVPGSLFFSFDCEGQANYLEQAISRGAVAFAVSKGKQLKVDVPILEFEDVRLAYSEACSKFFRNPSQEIPVFAVTGTNGKSTVALWVAWLASVCSEAPVGYIGTLGAFEITGEASLIRAQQNPTLTTPDAFDLQQLLRRFADNGCSLVCMEVSSHALSQKRAHTVSIDVAAFTNFSRDHLDYHDSETEYFSCKMKLFSEVLATSSKKNKTAVALKGSSYAKAIKSEELSVCELPKIIERNSSQMKVKFSDGVELLLPFGGTYNLENAVVVANAIVSLGYDWSEVFQVIPRLPKIEGRMQEVHDGVFVDFAHTPDAMKRVLEDHENAIAVFGCGGERDKGKRKLMGDVAKRYAKRTVVTTDNSRNEDSDAIIEDILSSGLQAEVEKDRKLAIETALQMKSIEDVVIIFGKGHEQYQEIAGVRQVFSDVAIIKGYYEK